MVSLLPHPASFRFHLAMDTLAFGYTLPTTGRVRDFHPLETCAAWRTMKTGISTRDIPVFMSKWRDSNPRPFGPEFPDSL